MWLTDNEWAKRVQKSLKIIEIQSVSDSIEQRFFLLSKSTIDQSNMSKGFAQTNNITQFIDILTGLKTKTMMKKKDFPRRSRY